VLLFCGACTQEEQPGPLARNACVGCHEDQQAGFVAGHAFAANDCTICHGGDSGATVEDLAHQGLVAFPGNLDNAEASCGDCHAERVASVSESLMHTGRGMVHTTRLVIDGDPRPEHTRNLQSLGDSVADSMLRKVCASCHLGQPKTVHAIDVTTSRGGGCLACHIAAHPEGAHPALTSEVSDARCFGCHSRSGRISLSYAGLAEVDESELQLADGRKVAQLEADIHYAAGMGCKDCHYADDVMGSAGHAVHQRDAVVAECTDCHEPHEEDADHERLECSACHSQWAPQCFGCHMAYDAGGEQWDHVDREMTAGRWHDRRWDVRNTLPALGVNAEGRIEVFVPGMIMTVAHPDWDEAKFVRMFAPLSPHTTGQSRSCESCHRSSDALGLGRGELALVEGELEFEPAGEILQDGLPADAWTNIGNTLGGRAPFPGQRPFDAEEMRRIRAAEIQ
jgi:predicted CXXCH cytochrome family protein